eukprot:1794596-Prymnesium_polylepis.1
MARGKCEAVSVIGEPTRCVSRTRSSMCLGPGWLGARCLCQSPETVISDQCRTSVTVSQLVSGPVLCLHYTGWAVERCGSVGPQGQGEGEATTDVTACCVRCAWRVTVP